MQNESFDSRMERDIQDVSETTHQQTGSVQSQKGKIPIRTMPTLEDITGKKVYDVHPPVGGADEKEFIHQMVEKISRRQSQDRLSEMPSLDLASQILAQQRKIAAIKRKSPLQNDNQQEGQPESVQISFMSPAPASPQQSIIADIVAREIEALSSPR